MNRILDARPDRLDLRDRLYQPHLENLPAQFPSKSLIKDFLPLYSPLILDQGNNGACTGFGLAAVINYLLWYEESKTLIPVELETLSRTSFVSPQMLFTLAKYYDEWPDDDNNSSSCRGAIKGWHHHGVCLERTWPDPVSYRKHRGEDYQDESFIVPDSGWEEEAARKPLGAYYRINTSSISDMQAAIHEVGAIYASAYVNEHWNDESLEPIANSENEYGLDLKRIHFATTQTGGHAFAIIGYCADGFVIQNSWGKNWGTSGFAILTYEGWVHHGKDAWVAVMGAPTKADGDFLVSSRKNGLQSWLHSRNKVTKVTSSIYRHLIEIGSKGEAFNNYIDQENGTEALKNIVLQAVSDEVLGPEVSGKYKHIAIVADSGLEGSGNSVAGYKRMADHFKEKGIYPIFLNWKNAIGDKICTALEKSTTEQKEGSPVNLSEQPAYDWNTEAQDRFFELICREESIKPLWDTHKITVKLSGKYMKCVLLLAEYLSEKAEELKEKGIGLHLVGFSAGSLLIGRLLDRIKTENKADSLSLLMPACTIEFANRNFLPVIKTGSIPIERIQIVLQDYRLELEDAFGPYRKSFLYLVSRALEDQHKTPLLGMQLAWLDDEVRNDMFSLESGIDEESDMMTWADTTEQNRVKKWLREATGRGLKPYCFMHEKSSEERNKILATKVQLGQILDTGKVVSHRSLAANPFLIDSLIESIVSSDAHELVDS